MADLASAQLLRLRWKGQKRIDLAVDEKLKGLGRRVGDPVDVFGRIEPDVSRQHSRNPDPSRTCGPYAYASPFQVFEAADAFLCKQLIASGMHAAERRDRLARVNCPDQGPRRVRVEIDLAASEV